MFLKASWVPDVAARPIGSMLPVIGAPGTWVQFVNVGPRKIFLTVSWVMLPSGFELFVMMQIASRAILVNTSPPGSPAAGSREEAPMETRPLATSEMPTLEPPCRILKPYFLPFLVLIQALASWVSSGKTEVDPLIVMIFFACA